MTVFVDGSCMTQHAVQSSAQIQPTNSFLSFGKFSDFSNRKKDHEKTFVEER